MTNKVQVFRLTPEVNKYYMTTTWTEREGKWPNEKYYSTNEIKYVGRFLRHVSHGYRDNASHMDIFDNNGVEEIVNYTYEGTTSFIETIPKIKKEIKEELFNKIYSSKLPQLQTLCKRKLSTDEIKVARELGFPNL